MPRPNELFDRIFFHSVTTNGLIRIRLTDWIEVWNMGNRQIPATTVTIENDYNMIISFTNTLLNVGFKTNLNQATFESGSLGKRDFAVPALLPNQYKVVPASTTPNPRSLAWQLSQTGWYAAKPIIDNWRLWPSSNDETANMRFKAYYGSTLIQESKGGRWPRYLSDSQKLNIQPVKPNQYIFNNPIGFASQDGSSATSAKPWHSGGDPRAQLFLSGALRSQNYTNKYASPGGRNWESANLSEFPESEVHPGKFWGDAGHAVNEDRGGLPSSASDDPDNPSFETTAQTNNFVMVRNDTGVMTNICELGNIYDPMQWSDQDSSPSPGQPGLWLNLSLNAVPDTRFGGRNTLRIGRAEHPRFTNNGLRASQLLDLFTATTNYYPYPTSTNSDTALIGIVKSVPPGWREESRVRTTPAARARSTLVPAVFRLIRPATLMAPLS